MGMKVVVAGGLIMLIALSILIIVAGAVMLSVTGLVEMPEEEVMNVLLGLAALVAIPGIVCMFAGMITCEVADGFGRPEEEEGGGRS